MDKQNEMVLEGNKIGSDIQPTMYGIFFEDINYAADGGLYGELIKNRSFEFPQNFMGWLTFGNVKLMDDGPFERNPHYVRLGNSGHREKHTGIENEGFFGIGVRQGCQYRFSVWSRSHNGPQKIQIELVKPNSNSEEQSFETKELVINSTEWVKYETTLTSTLTESKSHLRIFLRSSGEVDLCHVSLFPYDTYKHRTNGLRKDLVQHLYDLKPGIIRFPGGCIVEGCDEKTRYQWKNTVGKVENRPLTENRWHYTFAHRLFPDYFQSFGLGFYEFFVLAEDIGAEPLPILNVGLICQFQNDENQQIPIDRVGEFVKDALDLIEFANGDPSSEWGSVRSKMGHPKPFELKYIGIGNEQWGSIYSDRLKHFIEPIRNRYPEIKIIGSSGPDPEGEKFEYLWKEMKKLNVDLVDEHYYRNEEWFVTHADRYDGYDRSGPKVFAGEYACHGTNKKFNHFNAALNEAALMTGIERNADIVHMATYAPLFAHVDGWQWRPDLIWFDNLRSVRTCSYYVQQLFSLNKGTNVVPLKMDGKQICGSENQDGLFASSVWDSGENCFIIKVVNVSEIPKKIVLRFNGLNENVKLTNGKCVTFHSDDPLAENTLDDPLKVVPFEESVEIDGHVLNASIDGNTFQVYKFKKED